MRALDLWKDRNNVSRTFFDEAWDLMDGLNNPRSVMKKIDEMYTPACDVAETKDKYMLTFDMPGIKNEDMNIEIDGNYLVVTGEKKSEKEMEEGTVYRFERSFGKFQRKFLIPQGVNKDNIEANYEEGVLRVAIPKVAEQMPKKISIKNGVKNILKKVENAAEAKVVNS